MPGADSRTKETGMTRVNRTVSATAAGIAVLMTASTAIAASGEAGLPQLKIETWPSQIFWLVVIFGVGYIFNTQSLGYG